jgi:hypothetical protein
MRSVVLSFSPKNKNALQFIELARRMDFFTVEEAPCDMERMKPYTMKEIDAMLAESEKDFEAGRYYTMEEARAHRNAHRAKLLKS